MNRNCPEDKTPHDPETEHFSPRFLDSQATEILDITAAAHPEF